MKYITLIRHVYTYSRDSLISLFSFFILKLVPKKGILDFINSLKSKKVLVLGTGPSLNQLSQDLIDNYEVVFFLNNAINVSDIFNFNQKRKIIFNSDLFRFKDAKKKFYTLDKTWEYIFVPSHLQLFFSFILFYLKKKVLLLIPKYRLGSPFEKHVTKSIITYDLAKNHDTKNILKVDSFKVFPHSVALSVFHFLISCKVSQIHYLGCDFSSGKSLFVKYKGTSDFTNKKIYLWVNKLKKLSKNYSIDFKDLK